MHFVPYSSPALGFSTISFHNVDSPLPGVGRSPLNHKRGIVKSGALIQPAGECIRKNLQGYAMLGEPKRT